MTHDARPIDPRVMTHDARPIDPRLDQPSTLVLEPLERPCAHEFANARAIGRGRARSGARRDDSPHSAVDARDGAES